MNHSLPSKSERTRKIILQAAGAASILLLWQFAAILIDRPYILPPPLKVAASLVDLLGQPRFWSIFSGTLLRWLCGLIPAFVLGLFLGGLSAWSKSAGAFLQPFFTLVKSVPVVSITLLALIWFSAPLVPSFVVFLAVFPSISDNAAAGVKNIDHRLLDMAKVYHIEGHRRFFTIFLIRKENSSCTSNHTD